VAPVRRDSETIDAPHLPLKSLDTIRPTRAARGRTLRPTTFAVPTNAEEISRAHP
jgi:hypothetical protein